MTGDIEVGAGRLQLHVPSDGYAANVMLAWETCALMASNMAAGAWAPTKHGSRRTMPAHLLGWTFAWRPEQVNRGDNRPLMSIRRRGAFLAVMAAATVGVVLATAPSGAWAARGPRLLGGEAADAARAMAHMEHLSIAIGPRPVGTKSEAAAAEYIAQRLSEYGYTVSVTPVHRGVVDGLCVSQNVVAVSPAPEPGAKPSDGASIDSPTPDSPARMTTRPASRPCWVC